MANSLLKSLLSNWIGLGLSILIGFLISPMVVKALGPELYGSWALIISITGQAIVFDLGAKNAIINQVARYRHEHNIQTLSTFLSSGLFFFGICGAVSFLALLCLLPLFGSTFHVKAEYIFIVQVCFVVAALDAAAEVACGFYDSILAASERYDLMNIFNICRLVLNLFGVYLVLSLDLGLLGVALATLFSRLVYRWLQVYFAYKQNPDIKISPALIKQDTLKQLGSYGLNAALAQAAYRLIYRADTIIAGLLIGASGVAIYAVPVILIDQYRMFAESGNYILTPRFSALSASNDAANIRLLLHKWGRLSALLAIVIGCPLFSTGGAFINLWVGNNFAASTPIIQILSLPFFFVLPSMTFVYFLYATNQHKFCSYFLVIEALLSISCAVVLATDFGLNGIALATLFPAILIRGFLLPKFTCKLASIHYPDFLRYAVFSCLPLAAVHFINLSLLKMLIDINSWFGFIGVNAIALAILLILIYLFYLDISDKAYIKRRFLRC